LLAGKRYPTLVPDLRLVHPEGTEEYFAYSANTGARYEVNEVCYAMLSMMTGANDVEAICTATRQAYQGANRVTDDFEVLLEHLVRDRCITIDER
jgi:hypothetical protein